MNPNREEGKPEHNSHSQTVANKSQAQASQVSHSLSEGTSVSAWLKGKYSL